MSAPQPRPFSEELAEYREAQAAFEQRLWERWRSAFDRYDWVLIQAHTAAVYMLRHYRQEAVAQRDTLFEAQTRLHARAYRTACEVRALLLSGNPDGALARWRSLHEIVVVMKFLERHGAETAQRFLDYDRVQTARSWDLYEQMPPAWQVLPVTTADATDVRAERDRVVQEYGPAFQNENGWACAALGLTKDRSRVTFAQLEKQVEMEAFRFYIHTASHHVHVNMKGLANDLRADLAPTMRGFSAAAGTTLWGLAECTRILANLRPTPDTEVLDHDLERAVRDASQAFLAIEQQVEQESSRTEP